MGALQSLLVLQDLLLQLVGILKRADCWSGEFGRVLTLAGLYNMLQVLLLPTGHGHLQQAVVEIDMVVVCTRGHIPARG